MSDNAFGKEVDFGNAILRVGIKRHKTGQNEMTTLALGLWLGREHIKKGIELHMHFLRQWPFLRPGMHVERFPPPPPSPMEQWLARVEKEESWRVSEEEWAAYLAKVETEEAEKEEQRVAPGTSRKSFDGVVGHDQPYVSRGRWNASTEGFRKDARLTGTKTRVKDSWWCLRRKGLCLW